MDLVYLLRRGSKREIRYSLRSVTANLPHDRVWIAGWTPPNLRAVGSVPTVQDGTKWQNAKGNLRAACQHPDVSDPFVLMNDDFFVMEPITEVPVLNLGPLAEMVAWYRVRFPRSGYTTSAEKTLKLLQLAGHAEPLSYEAHVPFVVHKGPMLTALDLIGDDARLYDRSIYGNLAGIGGTRIGDVKVVGQGDPIPRGPFLSTSDPAFRPGGEAGAYIRHRFPHHCRYEAH